MTKNSMSKLEVKRFDTWAEAAPHRAAWNAVVDDAAHATTGALPSLFQTFEWNESWWRAFGGSYELLLLGVFESGAFVGAAPLIVSRRRIPVPGRIVHFIGGVEGVNLASDYGGFVYGRGRLDVIEAIGAWFEAHPALWNELELMNLHEDAPELEVLQRLFARGPLKPDLSFLCDAPTRALGDPEQDKDLVNRKSLKRHFNWFKNQGTLTYAHHDAPHEIHARLETFFEQHIGRRAITDTPSIFLDERQRRFYALLVDALHPLGVLRFFSVELDGAPIAFHFGFEYAGKFYWYKPTFDPALIRKSPGEVLLKTLFEYAVERKLKEFDFTAGSEGFKYRFSSQVRRLYRLKIFRTWAHYAVFRARSRTLILRARVMGVLRAASRKRAEESSGSD